MLVRAAIANSSVDFGGDDDSDTETAFMVQPGFGITFVAGDGWGIFGQVIIGERSSTSPTTPIRA